MREPKFCPGSIVVSTRGHDKGKYYVVVEIKDKRIAVADGKYKTLKQTKFKNPVHLRPCGKVNEEIKIKLETGKKVNDQMIYHALHEYTKSI